MANIHNLIVYREARELVRTIHPITANVGFGDLGNQIRRATISVVSNICEGAVSGSDKQFSRYLKQPASANEGRAAGNTTDIGAINKTMVQSPADRLGRRLTAFIKRLDAAKATVTHQSATQ